MQIKVFVTNILFCILQVIVKALEKVQGKSVFRIVHVVKITRGAKILKRGDADFCIVIGTLSVNMGSVFFI